MQYMVLIIQPDSLPSVALITIAPPAAANIELIATSSSIDPCVKPSTKVPPAYEASMIFSFEGAGSTTENIL